MRRILLFLLVAVASFILSACLTIEDKITIKADGSGEQVSTVDLGEMISNPFFKMSLEEEMKKNGSAGVEGRMDSTWTIIDQLGDLNPNWTAAQRELVGRAHGQMLIDFEKGEGFVKTFLSFDNLAQIDEFAQLMANANKPEEENPMGGIGSGGMISSTFELKGTKFARNSVTAPDFENPFVNDEMGDEMVDMAKQMFSDAVVIYSIEFPGNIKKVKGFEGHEVEGKTLTQVFDFLDMMDNPTTVASALTGTVKFK